MHIRDYLQFFSQETLGAPRPQSHLHEFIDGWLVPWERERISGKSSRVWSALSRTTRFTLGFERAPPSTDAAVDPSPCTSLWQVQKTAWWERQQRNCLLWFGAGLTLTVLPFLPTKTHVKDACKGKGRKSHNSLGSLRWTTTSNPTTRQAVPAHQCYMRSSGCWARSLPHAGCTARPALLWKHWRASHRSFCEERNTRFQSSLILRKQTRKEHSG